MLSVSLSHARLFFLAPILPPFLVLSSGNAVRRLTLFLSSSLRPFPSVSQISQKSFMGKSGLFDLEKHFAFYGAYHSNPVNILIHTLFVWPILFTTLMLLHFTPSIYSFPKCPSGLDYGLALNFGLLMVLVYSLFYFLFDKKAGSFAALLCFLCWIGASLLANKLGYSVTWKVVLATQLFCWTNQFIGHGLFEKRAPALLDNLAQAFLMAPFFVLLEVLQMMFKYEPYPGFQSSVKAKIDADIKEWHQSKQKKIS